MCQCISRTALALSRMFTPAIALDAGSSRIVVWRAQPPSSRRMWLSANDHFRFGIVPWSVAGGATV